MHLYLPIRVALAQNKDCCIFVNCYAFKKFKINFGEGSRYKETEKDYSDITSNNDATAAWSVYMLMYAVYEAAYDLHIFHYFM